MEIYFHGINTTLLLLVLVALGLTTLLTFVITILSRFLSGFLGKEKNTITYKSLIVSLALIMIVLWSLLWFIDIPHIDWFVLSYWPILSALIVLYLVCKVNKKEEAERLAKEKQALEELERLEAEKQRKKEERAKKRAQTLKAKAKAKKK